jgi:hypothetical protein
LKGSKRELLLLLLLLLLLPLLDELDEDERGKWELLELLGACLDAM